MRALVPFLAFFAIVALFFKLPELQLCKTCGARDPFIPLAGIGYFSFLIAISLLFSPTKPVAKGGLLWAILLSITLLWMNWPAFCFVCQIGHLCNISIWAIWLFAKPIERPSALNRGERLCLALFAPLSVVALFGSLNLTLMAYGSPKKQPAVLRTGDPVPAFSAQTTNGKVIFSESGKKMILNFITPNCPYCKEQLQILNSLKGDFEWINVSSTLIPEWAEGSTAQWVVDPDERIRKQFKVFGFPTLVVIGSDQKIDQVILGVPDHLKTSLRFD